MAGLRKDRATAWRRVVLAGVLSLAFSCLLVAAAAAAEPPATGNLMPVPASVTLDGGNLALDAHFGVKVEGPADPRLQRGVERMLVRLTKRTGIPIVRSGATTMLTVMCLHGRPGPQKAIEDESYSLRVASDGADLRAPTVYGVLRGLETFSQLV
jgi:hexosaminidase